MLGLCRNLQRRGSLLSPTPQARNQESTEVLLGTTATPLLPPRPLSTRPSDPTKVDRAQSKV